MLLCVHWFVAYPLSLRHFEQMIAERRIAADHSTVHRRAIKLLPALHKVVRRYKRPMSTSGRMDETYVKVRGQSKYLYRAVDQRGNAIDFFQCAQRKKAAALRFFERAIDQNGEPKTVTIDDSPTNLAALHDISAKREALIVVRQTKHLNNIVEQDFRAVKHNARPKVRFKDFRRGDFFIGGTELMHRIARKICCPKESVICPPLRNSILLPSDSTSPTAISRNLGLLPRQNLMSSFSVAKRESATVNGALDTYLGAPAVAVCPRLDPTSVFLCGGRTTPASGFHCRSRARTVVEPPSSLFIDDYYFE